MNLRKIAFAMEIPVAHLEELENHIDFHFVIASECFKNEAYFNYYLNYLQKPRNERKLIMLDNGMYEEGHPLSPNVLFDIATSLQPDIVWAPDCYSSSSETLRLTDEFLKLSKHGSWQTGVIPQGLNSRAVATCYENMLDLDFDGPIGMSFLNDREEVFNILRDREALQEDIPHHNLGLYNLEEITTWPSCVKSVDTVKPFKGAINNLLMTDNLRGLGKWNTRWKLEDSLSYKYLYKNLSLIHKALSIPIKEDD